MNKAHILIILVLLIGQCVPVSTTSTNVSKQLLLEDHNYEPFVGFVQIGPGATQGRINNPIVNLGGRMKIIFDLLENDFRYLNAKIIHCDRDWKRSQLRDLEFLSDFNEFRVDTYQYSRNNGLPYVQYQFVLPSTKISGNFILIVYNEQNDRDLILSRRFMVVDEKTSIFPEGMLSNGVLTRKTHQQIEFELNYEGLNVFNPHQELFVAILQNHRWDNAIVGLQPTQLYMTRSHLAYRHFNLENNFMGVNEFRFFDIKSLSYRGKSVESIWVDQGDIHASLFQEKPRIDQAYSEDFEGDINGNYYLRNIDPLEENIHSEYVWVHFNLKAEEIAGDTYVIGRFNNWQMDGSNQLHYNLNDGTYQGRILFKQGYFNYLYWTLNSDKPVTYFEGSHFQTENEYEILVYFREQGKIYDELVGYKLMTFDK